jgi:5-methylcytosine-specific restriction endonuclease McrA
MLNRRKPLKSKTPLKAKTGLKKTGQLKKRSKKMEDTYKERRPFVERILRERPLCEACRIFAAHDGKQVFNHHMSRDVHEIIRRSQGGSILDDSNVLAVCRPCHMRIGNYPELAFQLGLAKHGWERDNS